MTTKEAFANKNAIDSVKKLNLTRLGDMTTAAHTFN